MDASTRSGFSTPPQQPIQERSISLTEVESNLCRLLLDVVDFIEKGSDRPNVKAAPVPDDLSSEPLQLRFSGGWVRDKLLGITSKDIDVAINKMTGEQFGSRLKEFLDSPGVAARYGLANSSNKAGSLSKIVANPEKSKHLETVTTKLLGLDLDLVNLRKETYAEDSRNPTMEFGTPREDALRRDATINALFYNLHSSAVEDFTERGIKDLETGRIRTPLEPFTTFMDDPLRVLRLIRFASRFGFAIDSEVQSAMQDKAVQQALLSKITRERVWAELEKMLKGPNPRQAYEYIDKFQLYPAIFAVPGPKASWSPDLANWKCAYNALDLLLRSREDPSRVLKSILLGSDDDSFIAWTLTAFVPWTAAPESAPLKNGKRAPPMATIAAKEGIKAPNKIVDVLTPCLLNLDRVLEFARSDNKERDVLGMTVRGLGASWKFQLLFALLSEVYETPNSRDEIFSKYSVLAKRIETMGLLDVVDLQPIINGKDLQAALQTPAGPWIKSALEIVMAWQLRNPGAADQNGALEAIRISGVLKASELSGASPKAAKHKCSPDQTQSSKKKKGELTFAILNHSLNKILKPMFAQTPRLEISHAGRRKYSNLQEGELKHEPILDDRTVKPWKYDESWALDLLHWCVNILRNDDLLTYEPRVTEKVWGGLIPPILIILDDTDTQVRAKGCVQLESLLIATPSAFLSRTGLAPLFKDSLMASLTYLPTLTLENESAIILKAAYSALLQLINTWHPSPPKGVAPSLERLKLLDEVIRTGILFTFAHAGQYFRISEILLQNLAEFVAAEGIDSVKHLKDILPLLKNVLSDPFGPAYPRLLVVASEALQVVLMNAWPRFEFWCGDVLSGLTVCWLNLQDETPQPGFDEVKESLLESVAVARAVAERANFQDQLEKYVNELVRVEPGLKSLFQ